MVVAHQRDTQSTYWSQFYPIRASPVQEVQRVLCVSKPASKIFDMIRRHNQPRPFSLHCNQIWFWSCPQTLHEACLPRAVWLYAACPSVCHKQPQRANKTRHIHAKLHNKHTVPAHLDQPFCCKSPKTCSTFTTSPDQCQLLSSISCVRSCKGNFLQYFFYNVSNLYRLETLTFTPPDPPALYGRQALPKNKKKKQITTEIKATMLQTYECLHCT